MREILWYGSWDSKIWFIGMEEGGKDSATENAIELRLDLWKRRGEKDVEDGPGFYQALGYGASWFGPRPTHQTTWRQLIRILLHSKSGDVTDDVVLATQAGSWGRVKSESSIFEMFALPAPNTRDWPYQTFCDAWFLKSRGIYTHVFYNLRAAYFRQKIQAHRPKCVIFYGIAYAFLFEGLIQKSFEATDSKGIKAVSIDGTSFFLVRHPTARFNVNDQYFSDAGKLISRSLSK